VQCWARQDVSCFWSCYTVDINQTERLHSCVTYSSRQQTTRHIWLSPTNSNVTYSISHGRPCDCGIICQVYLRRSATKLCHGQELTVQDIVWLSPHGHRLEPASFHQFRSDYWRWSRSKLRCQVAGSSSKRKLTTWADSQFSLQWLAMSIGHSTDTIHHWHHISMWCQWSIISV